MSERTPSGASGQKTSHVILTFNRQLTDAEVRQLQSQHNAVSAVLSVGGHHHHDDEELE